MQEFTGEDEPEEKPMAALEGLFGRANKAAAETPSKAQPEKKPAKARGGLFGRASSTAEKAIDEIESEPKLKPFAGLLGGTKKVRQCHESSRQGIHHNSITMEQSFCPGHVAEALQC